MTPQDQVIPYGYCHCGCGQTTKIAVHRSVRYRYEVGEPQLFIHGHGRIRKKALDPQRYVIEDRGYKTPCWIWKGTKHKGYGIFRIKRRQVFAHAEAYRETFGDSDPKMDTDHLCRQLPCINPDHLEKVKHVINVRRGRRCKLDAQKAESIRIELKTQSQRVVAAKYGVHQYTIWAIANAKTWRTA